VFQVFENWNRSELDSFLIEITKDILKFKDSDGEFEMFWNTSKVRPRYFMDGVLAACLWDACVSFVNAAREGDGWEQNQEYYNFLKFCNRTDVFVTRKLWIFPDALLWL
jgi:hypothetical protein